MNFWQVVGIVAGGHLLVAFVRWLVKWLSGSNWFTFR